MKMSKADDIVYFKNYRKGLSALFVIYADFEVITEKVYDCQSNNGESYAINKSYQKHKDCGYGYQVICLYDNKYSKPIQI